MQFSDTPHDRRRFLRLAFGLSTGALLAGCGGGGSASSDTVAIVPAALVAATAPAVQTHPLNLALTLAYVGAQYHAFAARGGGLAASLIGGIGQPGAVSGARQATFAEPLIAGFAAELADDKQAHVAALRDRIGVLAAAQPQIDLSTGAGGAFAVAAQKAGLVSAGSGFDPYAGDTAFLIGALLVENAAAAAYRTLLSQGGDDATTAILQTQLADLIYHGGLIRALLDDRAVADSSIGRSLAGIGTMLAAIDGTNVGDQTLAGATGASSDILDAVGRPIPFTRAGAQVLKTLYLSASGVGGFLPAGANGVPG